jgi:hypothetical protein
LDRSTPFFRPLKVYGGRRFCTECGSDGRELPRGTVGRYTGIHVRIVAVVTVVRSPLQHQHTIVPPPSSAIVPCCAPLHFRPSVHVPHQNENVPISSDNRHRRHCSDRTRSPTLLLRANALSSCNIALEACVAVLCSTHAAESLQF